MHHLPGIRRVVGVVLTSLLAACSSGGNDEAGGSTRTEVSVNSLSFVAEAPDSPTPPSQTVSATFGSDVAHLALVHSGQALANVTSTISGRTAEIVVEPQAPSDLGSGIFSGAIAVTGYFCADAACSSLAAGNTQTVVVEYQISPIIQGITPYIATAGIGGHAIIRGVGFGSFAAQGVTFGTAAATEIALVSDTEIRVTYPALDAGSYEVQVQFPAHEGEIDSAARLVVLEPETYAAETLDYPAADPTVHKIIYDAERGALLLATTSGGGTILRYPFVAGAWGAPDSAAVSALRDISLSTNGIELFAASDTRIAPVDPVTLQIGTAVDAPELPTGAFLKNIEFSNDDRALVTTGIAQSSNTPIYIFTRRRSSITASGTTFNNATPGVSGNGAVTMLIQGHPSLTTNPSVFAYSATSNQLDDTGVDLNQNAIGPVLDRSVDRVILNGTNVYGEDAENRFALLGTLPTTTLAVAVNSAGTRAYTLDSAADAILTFDITSDEDGDDYAQIGSPAALAGDPGAAPKMIISPDNNTLFLAGSSQIVIQPTPVAP